MNAFRTRSLIALAMTLVFAHEATAQRARRTSRKPFAAFSESAERLKDSLKVRLRPAGPMLVSTPAPFVSAKLHEWMLRDSIVAVARSQIGTRYRWGAETPGKAFDCSGFVRFVMSALRIELPRTADEQGQFGEEIARDTASLRPGDILTFGTAKRLTHIGIYAGEGRVIHASTTRRQIIETRMEGLGSKLLGKWQSARRLVAVVDSTAG